MYFHTFANNYNEVILMKKQCTVSLCTPHWMLKQLLSITIMNVNLFIIAFMKRMFVSKCSNDFTVPCQINDTVLNYCQRGEVDFFLFCQLRTSHISQQKRTKLQYSTIRIEMNNVAKTTRNYLCAFLSLISAYMLMDLWQISFFFVPETNYGQSCSLGSATFHLSTW